MKILWLVKFCNKTLFGVKLVHIMYKHNGRCERVYGYDVRQKCVLL